MKKSLNSRLTYARENNQYAAEALLKNSSIYADQKIDKDAARPKKRYFNKTWSRWEVIQDQEVSSDDICICKRQAQVIECTSCKMLFYGRVSEPCPLHPNVTYLLDFFYCPSCTCSKDLLKIKNAAI